jgi:hypothetical protein
MKDLVKTFPKYKMNLRQIGPYIWSYASPVALVDNDVLIIQRGFKKYSPTTSKHINYVAEYLNLYKIYLDDKK